MMTDDGFKAEVSQLGSGAKMQLSGTVNRSAKERMEEAYDEASALGGNVAMDFTNVDYINSTGIAVIVGVLAMARSQERDVSAYGLTEHYQEVFRITRLSDFMNIHEEALT